MSRRKPKITRRVRIRMDFVVEFDRDLPTLPIGMREDYARLMAAMLPALAEMGVAYVSTPFSFSTALDYRPVAEKKAAGEPGPNDGEPYECRAP